MGVTQGAGLSLQWFRNQLAPGTDYDELTAEAATSPCCAQGLYWLPYLMGERTPHLDAYARGGWIGLTAKHTRADLIRALIEGVSFSLKDCLDIIEDMGVPVESVRVSGGGARSAFWRQMLADIFAQTGGDAGNAGRVGVRRGAAGAGRAHASTPRFRRLAARWCARRSGSTSAPMKRSSMRAATRCMLRSIRR